MQGTCKEVNRCVLKPEFESARFARRSIAGIKDASGSQRCGKRRERERKREREEEEEEPVVVMGSPVVRKTLGEGERFTCCIT